MYMSNFQTFINQYTYFPLVDCKIIHGLHANLPLRVLCLKYISRHQKADGSSVYDFVAGLEIWKWQME